MASSTKPAILVVADYVAARDTGVIHREHVTACVTREAVGRQRSKAGFAARSTRSAIPDIWEVANRVDAVNTRVVRQEEIFAWITGKTICRQISIAGFAT